jgi:uncharacterized protein YyaL (SSP411 family)
MSFSITGLIALAAVLFPIPQDHPASQKAMKNLPKNHLKNETSPYLLEHSTNPVDWYPWGKEAFEKAKKEKKPIFLSIGYSACHWCHVMERESFKNAKIAKMLNDWFVCIKVDREERPDIDAIYMAATVRMNRGSGGWPMSVFLTTDLKPFFAGTYYPPSDRGGMPGFDRILTQIHKLWTEDKKKLLDAANQVQKLLHEELEGVRGGELPGKSDLARAVQVAKMRFDSAWGGFGQAPTFAPKFPHSTELTALLRYGKRANNKEALNMVSLTLHKMAEGGMYDQCGGGFHRYSVDRFWLAPHFEKMLYDNSQLAMLYLEAWQATGESEFLRISRETLDYVAREMLGKEGGFYSTTDADSEGEEGKFFVWTAQEFQEVLGDDAPLMMRFFGVTESGNFEGKNILTRRTNLEDFAKTNKMMVAVLKAKVAEARALLYAARNKRVHPHLDDKILSSWNGLMLQAFARAAAVLGDGTYLKIAQGNADFLLNKMRDEKGHLFRTRRLGRSRLPGFLEDYSFVTAGLIELYHADPDPRWIKEALKLQAIVEDEFVAPAGNGYASVSKHQRGLIVRVSSAQESSLPSDVGVAAMNAYRLGLLAGDPKLTARAHDILRRHSGEFRHFPNAYGQLLILVDFLDAEPQEVYVVGDPAAAATEGFLNKLRKAWPPYRVFAFSNPNDLGALAKVLPAAEGKEAIDGKTTAYVCTEGVCKAPIMDPKNLK